MWATDNLIKKKKKEMPASGQFDAQLYWSLGMLDLLFHVIV